MRFRACSRCGCLTTRRSSSSCPAPPPSPIWPRPPTAGPPRPPRPPRLPPEARTWWVLARTLGKHWLNKHIHLYYIVVLIIEPFVNCMLDSEQQILNANSVDSTENDNNENSLHLSGCVTLSGWLSLSPSCGVVGAIFWHCCTSAQIVVCIRCAYRCFNSYHRCISRTA